MRMEDGNLEDGQTEMVTLNQSQIKKEKECRTRREGNQTYREGRNKEE